MKLSTFFSAVLIFLLIAGSVLVGYSVIFEREEGFVFKTYQRMKSWITGEEAIRFTADLEKLLKLENWNVDNTDQNSVYNRKSDFLIDNYLKMKESASSERLTALKKKRELLKNQLGNKVGFKSVDYDKSIKNVTDGQGKKLWQPFPYYNIIVNSAKENFKPSNTGLNGAIYKFAQSRGGITQNTTWTTLTSLYGGENPFSIKSSEFNEGKIFHCYVPRPEDFDTLHLNIFTYYFHMFMSYKRILMFASQQTGNIGTVILSYLAGSERMRHSGSHGINGQEYAIISQVAALEAVNLVMGNRLHIVINVTP